MNIEELLPLAYNGDFSAQYDCARYYIQQADPDNRPEGDPIRDQNMTDALTWLKRCAKQGLWTTLHNRYLNYNEVWGY